MFSNRHLLLTKLLGLHLDVYRGSDDSLFVHIDSLLEALPWLVILLFKSNRDVVPGPGRAHPVHDESDDANRRPKDQESATNHAYNGAEMEVTVVPVATVHAVVWHTMVHVSHVSRATVVHASHASHAAMMIPAMSAVVRALVAAVSLSSEASEFACNNRTPPTKKRRAFTLL